MESCGESMFCCLNDCDTLNWKNPIQSGMILAGINAFFLMMAFSKMNPFTIIAYLFLFYVVSGVAVSLFSEKPEKDDDEYEHVSKDTFEKLLKWFYNTIAQGDALLKKVTSLEDLSFTVKFYGALYAFIVISGWFCDCLLIWVAVNALFLWKPVYNFKKDLVDGLCAQAKQIVGGLVQKVDSFIPKYKEPTKRE